MSGPIPVLAPGLAPILIHVLVPNLMDMMIVQDQGPLEVEAMAEAIERTAMLTVDMRGVKSVGIVKRNDVSIILWYVLNGPFVFSEVIISQMYY